MVPDRKINLVIKKFETESRKEEDLQTNKIKTLLGRILTLERDSIVCSEL